jgi:hypothetical protein
MDGREVRGGPCLLFAVDNRVQIGNRRPGTGQMGTRRNFIASVGLDLCSVEGDF